MLVTKDSSTPHCVRRGWVCYGTQVSASLEHLDNFQKVFFPVMGTLRAAASVLITLAREEFPHAVALLPDHQLV